MDTVILTGEVIAAVLVGLVLAFLLVTLARRRLIAGDAIPVLCALRLPGSRWRAGLLKITPSTLLWFPLFGVTTRPRHVWGRDALDAGETAPIETVDASGPFVGVIRPVRVDFTVSPAPSTEPSAFELGLSADAYTAVRAWLEAGPPMDWRVET